MDCASSRASRLLSALALALALALTLALVLACQPEKAVPAEPRIGSASPDSSLGEGSLVGPDGRRPNILLIDIDSLRADRIDLRRDGEPVAPTLLELAEGGVRFDQVFAQSAWTIPSLLSVLTGRYPVLGVASDQASSTNTLPVIPTGVRTLPEILGLYGYHCRAFWGSTVPRRLPTFWQGFELDPSEFGPEARNQEPAPFGEAIEAWIEAGPPEPFFVLLHDMDLHHPRPDPSSAEAHLYVSEIESWRPEMLDRLYPFLASRVTRRRGAGSRAGRGPLRRLPQPLRSGRRSRARRPRGRGARRADARGRDLEPRGGALRGGRGGARQDLPRHPAPRAAGLLSPLAPGGKGGERTGAGRGSGPDPPRLGGGTPGSGHARPVPLAVAGRGRWCSPSPSVVLQQPAGRGLLSQGDSQAGGRATSVDEPGASSGGVPALPALRPHPRSHGAGRCLPPAGDPGGADAGPIGALAPGARSRGRGNVAGVP